MIKQVRADQVRVGDVLWYNGRVESIEEYGPMLGEAYGYARNVEIVCAPFGGITTATVQHLRGDLPVKLFVQGGISSGQAQEARKERGTRS